MTPKLLSKYSRVTLHYRYLCDSFPCKVAVPDTSAEFSEEIGHRSRDIGGDRCYRISLSQLGNIRQSEEWSVISITRANNEYDESEDNQDEDDSEGTEKSEADDESSFMMSSLSV